MSKNSTERLDPKGKKNNLKKLLDVNSSNSGNGSISDPTFPLPSNISSLPIGQSDILSKVQAFLPQLKKANEELEQKDLSKLDIESVDEDGQYIEMNLGLGVYDMKNSEQSDSDEDVEEEENSNEEKLKIPNNKNQSGKKPVIEEL
ncbi:hypothetical protein BDF20DRAFT_659550 [Mycotypha africana]|uniref:uncharacterized protein n=1 Tax=Mycotypha africana TaxID=64632 RepID=UPI002301B5D7|nr:uncharacterized protein BDF20DRAFT_659550 [Mycotypha africana]KAI8973571.1 hypothetical protein BDF20DRAFT_659550 [Mycotypha africana]